MCINCEENNEKIILPQELQERMMKFFLKTSIPRKVKLQETQEQEKSCLMSEKISDRSGENGTKNGNLCKS